MLAITFIYTVFFAALALAIPTDEEVTPFATMQMLMEGERQIQEVVRMYNATMGEELRENVGEMAAIEQAGGCEPAVLIFARGTFEPEGTDKLGFVVGMPFATALKKVIPSMGAVGVEYNNSVAGYLSGGDTGGGKTMAKMITDKANACPNTKIFAGGYRSVLLQRKLPWNTCMLMPIQSRSSSHTLGPETAWWRCQSQSRWSGTFFLFHYQ